MKKIPIRKCVVTKEHCPKNELIRIVCNKEQEVLIDESGRLNGRGAYLKLEKKVIEKAIKSNALGRALKCNIPTDIYDKLNVMLESK